MSRDLAVLGGSIIRCMFQWLYYDAQGILEAGTLTSVSNHARRFSGRIDGIGRPGGDLLRSAAGTRR